MAPDLIAIGDFNIDRRGDELFDAFTSTGLIPAPSLNDVPRTIFEHAEASQLLDRIAWSTDEHRGPLHAPMLRTPKLSTSSPTSKGTKTKTELCGTSATTIRCTSLALPPKAQLTYSSVVRPTSSSGQRGRRWPQARHVSKLREPQSRSNESAPSTVVAASTSSTTRSARRARRDEGTSRVRSSAVVAARRVAVDERLGEHAHVERSRGSAPSRRSAGRCAPRRPRGRAAVLHRLGHEARIPVMPFSSTGPSSHVQPSSAVLAWSSSQIRRPATRRGPRRAALDVVARELRRAEREEREAALVVRVDELVDRRRDLGEDAEPGERILALERAWAACGDARRQTPWKPSQPATTSHSSSCAAPSCAKRMRGRPESRSCTVTSSTSNSIGRPPAIRAATRSFTTSVCP